MKRTTVLVIDGLRLHVCPKVAYGSIIKAVEPLKPNYSVPEEQGPEKRFMCVRHPLDRMVSCWTYFCQDNNQIRLTGSPGLGELGYYYAMPFPEFLSICMSRHSENHHTMMQIDFAGPHTIDYLFPLHRLKEGWNYLRSHFSVGGPIEHTHRTQHKEWQQYYSNSQRDAAETLFSKDIALYEQALTQADEHLGTHSNGGSQ